MTTFMRIIVCALVVCGAAYSQANVGDGGPEFDEALAALNSGDQFSARDAFHRACLKDHTHGCFNAGKMMFDGMGGEVDLPTARSSFEHGCGFGEAAACIEYGNMAYLGQGGDIDKSATRFAMSTACSKGSVAGCLASGGMFANGDGVTQSSTTAAESFRSACQLESAVGCFELGRLAENGIGLRGPDLAEAKAAYTIGCNLEHQESCQARARMK